MIHHGTLHADRSKMKFDRDLFCDGGVYFPTYLFIESRATYQVIILEMNIVVDGKDNISSFTLPLTDNTYKNIVTLKTPCPGIREVPSRSPIDDPEAYIKFSLYDFDGHPLDHSFQLVMEFFS